jgi:hypothetical protein
VNCYAPLYLQVAATRQSLSDTLAELPHCVPAEPEPQESSHVRHFGPKLWPRKSVAWDGLKGSSSPVLQLELKRILRGLSGQWPTCSCMHWPTQRLSKRGKPTPANEAPTRVSEKPYRCPTPRVHESTAAVIRYDTGINSSATVLSVSSTGRLKVNLHCRFQGLTQAS